MQSVEEFRVSWKRTGGWPLTREFRSVLEAGEYLAALQDGSPFEYVFMERRTIVISDWEIMAETSLPSDLIDAPDGRPADGTFLPP